MRTMMLAALAAVAATTMTGMGAATAARAGTVTARPATPGVLGVWSNPKGTLAVRTLPCADGATLCGAIVRAGPTAVADAKEAGVAQLVGTQLLQGYRPIGGTGRQGAAWSGRVFVPDMGRSFSSRLRQTGVDELTISGCLIGGMFCRSQAWHRVG